LAFTGGVIAALALAACGGDTDSATSADDMDQMWEFVQEEMPGLDRQILEDACEEGKIDANEFSAPNIVQMGTEFNKIFPCIQPSVTSEDDTVVYSRFMAGVDSGTPPDILTLGSENTMLELVDQGLLMQYTPTSADKVHCGDPEYFCSFQINSNGIGFNTDMVDRASVEAIKTWEDVDHLFDPTFDGVKLGMKDPGGEAAGGSYYTVFMLNEVLGQDKVADLLEHLDLTLYSGSGDATKALTAGEIGMFMGNDLSILDAAAQGAPVEFIWPEPRIVTYPAIGIAADAPHPNAAKLYVEFTLSKYGQALRPELFANAPARADVPDTRPGAQLPFYVPPEEQEIWEPTNEELAAGFDEVIEPYRKYQS